MISEPAPRRFRALAIVTAVAVYLQIVLGGVVRISGSGLGCPDWPLCHGQIVPSFDYRTLIEYTHRLAGAAAILLVVVTAVYAVALHGSRRGPRLLPKGLMLAALASLLLILVQGAVGGITVLLKNSPLTVAVHLGNALLVLAAALLVALWAGRVGVHSPERPRSNVAAPLFWLAAIAAYAIVVSGAVVVGGGASSACTGWPLCGATSAAGRSLGLPLTDLHMLHRTLVLSGGLLILGALYAARRHWRGTPMLAVVYLTAAALALEVVIGWLQVSLGLPAGLRALHLAIATVVWGGAVLMVFATQLEGAEESAPQERRLHRVAEVGLQP